MSGLRPEANGRFRPKADLGATGRDGHVFYVRIRFVDTPPC
jgi:hypothetical protein